MSGGSISPEYCYYQVHQFADELYNRAWEGGEDDPHMDKPNTED